MRGLLLRLSGFILSCVLGLLLLLFALELAFRTSSYADLQIKNPALRGGHLLRTAELGYSTAVFQGLPLPSGGGRAVYYGVQRKFLHLLPLPRLADHPPRTGRRPGGRGAGLPPRRSLRQKNLPGIGKVSVQRRCTETFFTDFESPSPSAPAPPAAHAPGRPGSTARSRRRPPRTCSPR